MYTPTPEDIGAVEAHIDRIESAFREHYAAHPLVGKVEEGGDPSAVLEVSTFAFGLTASVLRSMRAITILTQQGYGVECRPVYRSLLDQVLALYSVKAHGVHAVHAYGKQLARNYELLLKASDTGMELGKEDRAYIEMFLNLSAKLPSTPEGRAAENAIKTFYAGQSSGEEGAAVYQMWLEATPLSKPSMRLSDQYIRTLPTPGGYRVELHFDSDPDAVVDARLILATVVPIAMVLYAEIVDDAAFGLKAIELAETSPRPSTT